MYRKIPKTVKGKTDKRNCKNCNALNWSPNHKCSAQKSTYHICEKREHLAKVCRLEHQRQNEFQEIKESEETEERDTDMLLNIISEKEHVTEKRNHIIKTLKIYARKILFLEDWITGYNITTRQNSNGEQENVIDKKTFVKKK